jgi:uncharacterized membrane protein
MVSFVGGYCTDCLSLLQWFLSHLKCGRERKVPLSPHIVSRAGILTATRYILWIGEHCPGFNYPNKQLALVSLDATLGLMGFNPLCSISYT